MIMKNKRAVSIWISYLLLLALVMGLAAFYYDWSINFTHDQVNATKQDFLDSSYCRKISIEVLDAYQKNPQSLYIKIKNNNKITIDKLIIQGFNNDKLAGEAQEIKLTLKPGQVRELVIKNNNETFVEITPVIIRDKLPVVCTEKSIRPEISH